MSTYTKFQKRKSDMQIRDEFNEILMQVEEELEEEEEEEEDL